tara:strand:- start:46 stop:447 length:402 start_codon:yes stop_codon:yes gene_type:complete
MPSIIILKEHYIIKKCKYKSKYINERDFYLNSKKHNLDFIPKLYAFNDKLQLLFIENVGTRVSKNKIDWNIIKIYFEKLVSLGYYHNDIRSPNVVYDLNKDKYYLIDFEHVASYFKDYKIRNNIFYKLIGYNI